MPEQLQTLKTRPSPANTTASGFNVSQTDSFMNTTNYTDLNTTAQKLPIPINAPLQGIGNISNNPTVDSGETPLFPFQSLGEGLGFVYDRLKKKNEDAIRNIMGDPL